MLRHYLKLSWLNLVQTTYNLGEEIMKNRPIFYGAVIGLFMYSLPVYADIIHYDDVIASFSLCVGNDCVNGENFGFDTLRLKENNLRIHFQDTSTTASFPTNDWRIIANDSSNGGASYLAFEDSSASRQVFRVDAGAPANALRVDSGGDVGIGTSNPVVDLHIRNGNTPTLRLEQDGSSGFTPQTWDVAGNEANFFIRDATHGSTLPFRIFPGAPSNSVNIEGTTGHVGFGNTSPEANVHIQDISDSSGGENLLYLENNGNPQIVLENINNNNTWQLSAGSNFSIKHDPTGTPLEIFRLSSTGQLTIPGAIITGGGTCNAPSGCDLVFSSETTIESIEEHAHQMWTNAYLPSVGPTVEYAPFNLTEKTGGMLNELEKAHIYIEQLHNRLKDREKQLDMLSARLEKLESKL